MADVTVATRINAPVREVWDVFTDLDAMGNRLSGITSMQRLDDGGPFAVGTRWTETRVMFGKEASETMWIDDMESERFYTVHAESNGTKYISEVRFAEDGDHTNVEQTFTGVPQNLLSKVMSSVMMPFFKGTLRKQLQQDLDDLKRASEEQAAQN